MPLNPAADYLPQLPDPLAELGLSRAPVRRRRPRALELSPEEQQSVLGSLASPVLSGVERVGWVLDTPGALVRGLLAGHPEGKWRVSGREMLERWGLLGRNQPGFDWGDVAGFAAEVLLDPLTYLTFGGAALSKAGRLAKAAGILRFAERGGRVGPRVARMTTTLRQAAKLAGKPGRKALFTAARAAKVSGAEMRRLLREPLGGLVGVSPIPTGQARWVLGKAGGRGEQLAHRLDVLGEAVKYSMPVRHLSAIFDPRVHGTTTARAQQYFRQLAPRLRLATEEARGVAAKIARALEEAGVGNDREALQGILSAIEQGGRLSPELAAKGLAPVVGEIKTMMKGMLDNEQFWGLSTQNLSDIIDYFVRQRFHFAKPMEMTPKGPRAVRRLALNVRHPFERMRERFLRGHPGGTAVIMDISVDPRFSGLGKLPKEQLREKTSELLREYGERLKPRPQKTEELAGDALKRARAKWRRDIRRLTKWAAELDPQHVELGVPAFSQDIAGLVLLRREWSNRATETAKQVYGLIVDTMMPASAATADDVPVLNVLSRAGLKGAHADKRLAEFASAAWQKAGKGMVNPEDLKKYVIPRAIADDLVHVMRGFTVPEEVSGILRMVDNFLDWWRAHVTVYWPAFQTRNVTGGLIQNALVTGHPLGSLRAFTEVWNLMRGKRVPGLLDIPLVKRAGIKDAEEAEKFIGDLLAQYGMMASRSADILELGAARAGRGVVDRFGLQIPGLVPQPGLLQTIRRSFGHRGTFDPLNVETFGPLVAGRQVSLRTETALRGSLFLTLLRQGYDPAVAAAKVRLAHVDYSSLTRVERKVFRRIIPFYSFARGQAMFLADELLKRPGGRVAQTIRAANALRGGEQFVPDYIRQTLAIPIPPEMPLIGPGETGDPRFLTGAGLMFEDPLQFFAGAPGLEGLSRGITQEIGSRLAPYFKGPIEWATGASLFQAGPKGGRMLEDMDPLVGRILANIRDVATGSKPGRPVRFPGSRLVEQTVSQVVPRPLTTARTLTDPRKGIIAKMVNVMTGARLYDLPQRTQEALVREAVEQKLGETGLARAFKRTYVPPEELAELTPVERAEIERQLAMLRLLGNRATARAKGQTLEPLPTW